jgi:hypothetical protein
VERGAGAAHLGAAALILDLDAFLDGPLDAAVFVGWRGVSPSFEGQMMRYFDALLAVCFGLLLMAVAHAEPIVAVMGGGQNSCGKFIGAIGGAPPGKYREMNTGSGVFVSEYRRYQEWLMGFVSGFNSAHSDDFEQQVKIDLAGMDLWMRNWCNQHPTKKVFQAASAFINEMLTNAAQKQ